MKVKFFKALWGMNEGATLTEKFKLAKEAGFDGIEAAVSVAAPEEWKALSEEFKLDYIAQIFPLTPDDMKKEMDQAKRAGAIKAVSHSGRDKWSYDDGEKFWREAIAIEKDFGLAVAHETHRHRMLFSPWSTCHYLRTVPELVLCMDLSHFCCVCETLLEDQEDEVKLVIDRTIHMHARVGHREGPQANHPGAPEWKEELDRHCGWWDQLKSSLEKRGAAEMTITPEFGPPKYMQTLPFTNQPVVSHWDVNIWMRDYLKKRWGI